MLIVKSKKQLKRMLMSNGLSRAGPDPPGDFCWRARLTLLAQGPP